jgi:hypothetical protein
VSTSVDIRHESLKGYRGTGDRGEGPAGEQ